MFKKATTCFENQRRRFYTKTNPSYKNYGAKGIDVKYTLQEFIKWYVENYKEFDGYKSSVGRIDHSGHYSLDNIRFESLAENSLERIRRVGPTRPRREVIIIDWTSGEPDPVFIAESLNEAARLTGVHSSHIPKYCQSLLKKSVNNFSFQYLNPTPADIRIKKPPRLLKRVDVIQVSTGNICFSDLTVKQASKKTGIYSGHIYKYCDGTLKKTKSGLTFRWAA